MVWVKTKEHNYRLHSIFPNIVIHVFKVKCVPFMTSIVVLGVIDFLRICCSETVTPLDLYCLLILE